MQHGAHGEGTGGGGQRTGISEGTGSRGQRTGICEGAGGGDQAEGTEGSGGQRTGICKWFNVVRGYGFIQPHDGSHDVFVHQSVIKMAGFRSLAEGEEVEFDSQPSDKGVEATFVCGVQGSDCKGSDRRPISKKKFRKIRCFNCGEYANHIAAKCPHPPLPKRCHNCKSSDHLIADCPQRKQENSETENGGQAETGEAGGIGEHSSNGGDSPTPPSLETSSGTMSGLAS